MRNATLILLFREIKGKTQVCLAMKKRGFGAGRPNGYGGKVREEIGESAEEAAIRELREEGNVSVRKEHLEKLAVVDFYFPEAKKEWNQRMHVFAVKKWQGKLKETGEMKPAWFNIKKIPFERMWEADKHWMPLVLQGEKFKAEIIYDENQRFESFKVLGNLVKRMRKDARTKGMPKRKVFRKSPRHGL